MLLNFYGILILSWQYIIFYFTLLISLSLNTYYTNIYDFLSRIVVNDFLINSFYYLWTSFWYIPLLLFGLVLYLLSQNPNMYYGIRFLFFYCFFILLLSDLINYWFLNIPTLNYLEHNENFNNLLSNSINKYHPGIFYFTSLPIVYNILLLNTLFLTYKVDFTLNQVKSILMTRTQKTLTFITLTLFLGGWWALQEGSWGGWWNWDPSEVFGLLFIFFYAWQIHKIMIKKSIYMILSNNILVYYIIFLVYVFIQLNFDLVSHNFGTKTNQFIDSMEFFEFFLTGVSIIMLSIVYTQKKNTIKSFNVYAVIHQSKFRTTLDDQKIWIYSLALLVGLQLLSAFMPLINDFTWKIFALNVTNTNPNWIYFNFIIIILLVSFWWNYNQVNNFVFLLSNSCFFNYLFWIPSLKIKIKQVNLLHFFLICTFSFSVLNSVIVLNHWAFLPITLTYNTQNNVYLLFETLKLNNTFIEITHFYLSHTNISSTFNFLLHDSTSEIYSFLLNMTTNFQQQSLVLGNIFYYYVVNTYDFLPQSIFNLFILWLIWTSRRCQLKQCIIF